ncbi:MAG: 6-bladed beta-propeller, partial [Candidatus Kariarchaeaceae archaeon]
IAIDSQGNIFVSDIQTYIQKFDSSGNFLLGWGALGTDPSQFDNPRGLAIDSEDNVYVADGNNYRIQKFDNDGNFLEIISGPGVPLGYLQIPYDVTFDSLGDLYVADTGNNRIQIFDSNGVFKEAITNSEVENGKFNRPRAVTVDSNNFIYVADTYNNRIQVFDSDNNFVRSFGTLGNNPGEFANPSGIIATDDGKLYVTDTSNDRIQVFDSATGNFLFEFEFRESSVEPYFAAFDDSGNLLVADGHSHKIITIDPLTDSVISEFGTLGIDPGELRGPRGIAFDQDGNIYVGDNYNNRVNKYDSAGNFLLSWGDTGDTPGAFLQVRGMAIDSNGDVLVADTQNNRIQKFDSDGNFISLFDSFLPYQISLDDQDNLYVAEENADVVTKYDSNGNPTLVIGTSGAGPGEFLIPKGVTIDTNGDIFIADSGNGRIQKFDSDGNFIDMIGTLGTEDSQFNNPRGLTMDSDRNLWVCDTGNFRIQVFDNNLNYIKTVDFPSLGDPINNSPIAADESYSTGEDIPLPITLSASDADGDSLTYSVVVDPTNGVLSGTAPNLTYTPNSNYIGEDSFTFTANDGAEDSNIATISITVNPVIDVPVVSIGLDHGFTSQNDAAQYMTDKNMTGSIFYVTQNFDNSLFINATKLLQLQNDNWEIVSHTNNHTLLVDIDQSIIDYEVVESKIIFEGMGFQIYGFTPPFIALPEPALTTVEENYNWYGYVGDPVPQPEYDVTSDTYRVPSSEVGTGSLVNNFTSAKIRIDDAINNDQWLVLNFHKIDDNSDDPFSYPLIEFQKIIDYLDETNVSVLPISEVIGLSSPTEPTPNNPPTAANDGPYTGTQGVSIDFDGSTSSDSDGTIV